MTRQRNALRTGIFTLLSIGLGAVVIVAIGGGGRFTKSYDTYTVAFGLNQNVGGLRAGDDVRIGGWKVGDVRDINLHMAADGNPAKLIVRIDVPAEYPLGRDARIVVEKGITSGSVIDIENLGQGPKATDLCLDGRPDAFGQLVQNLGAASGRLPATEDRIDRDLDKFGTTADAFSETGYSATSLVNDVRARIPGIVDRYSVVAGAADAMLDSVREFIGPGSNDFHASLANIHQVTGDLRERVPDLMDRVRGLVVHVDGVIGHASSAMADVQATAANAKDATSALRSVLADNKSKLDGIIGSLKSTSDNLKAASVEIRHSPWRLLYQPKPDEMANLNTYDSVRQFAEGAGALDDAATALRDALADKNADPAQIKKLMDRLDDSFAKFQQEQDKLWAQVKQ